MAVVVVAEDDPDLRFLYRYTLERDRHIVHEATNGADALSLVLECKPDLVLTDHAMPRMTGAELCGALHADARTTAIPVIMITASADPDTMRALLPHLAACLNKPARPDAVTALVTEVLRQRTAPE